nr:uncharacterized protein [Drosophila biauraria male killing partitivirus 1]
MEIKEESDTGTVSKDTPKQSNNNKKRKGKGAQKRSTENYRNRRNEQQLSAEQRRIEEKYNLLRADDGPLKAAIDNVPINAQPVAVPLSVTTRGIGSAVAVAYSRTCTTWNFDSVEAVATIHQVYRVSLMCAHLKVYLAQQVQVESVAVSGVFRRLVIQDELREILTQISQVPSVLALILDCIGKIECDGSIWHVGYPEYCQSESQVEYRYLTLNPDTILDTLAWLSDDNTPEAQRVDFINHNPIPGAQFAGNLLQNAATIWPLNYDSNAVRFDVHCFKNWITRVETRLPGHSFPTMIWSGIGTCGGLVSTEPVDLRIVSTFESRISKTPVKVIRDASGSKRTTPGEVVSLHLVNVQVLGSRSDFWSPQPIKTINYIMGSASLVGEVCCIETRHEINARERFSIDPVTMVMNLCDAPRK